MENKKYQVIITYNNNDYCQTYFNAANLKEIIQHYKGHLIEYYDGSNSGVAYGLDIKDMEDNKRYVYYYENNKLIEL